MLDINRENGPVLLFVLIALFAIGATAATISDVSSPGGETDRINIDFGGGGLQEGGGQNSGDQSDVGEGGEAGGSNNISLQYCIPFLTTATGILGIVAVNVLILAGIKRQFNTATTIFAGFAIVPVVVGIWALLTNCITSQEQSPGITGGSFLNNEQGVVSSTPVDPGLLALAFGALVFVSLAVMFTMTMSDSDEVFEPVTEEEEPEPDEAAFARAAGRAADRIEQANVSVDNAVYEAWVEMTRLLNLPNPETSAPMDFADAAVETGLDADDVYRLTALFNEVRYGHKDPTEREEQAIETLRHIESAYEAAATDDGDGPSDTSESSGGDS